ncbi:hypothetical protein B0H11DRAFT_2229106 [Mycena galericulata]|nr:hypothetical protein B0H11DRAFT_2229106 [Mycena galericulata]
MGRGSPFSPEQDKHIESFFPALMTHPTADVKTWKKDTADAISKSPLFLGKLPSKAEDPTKGGDLAEWKIRIERKFQNYLDRHRSGYFYFSPLSGISLFEKEEYESIFTAAEERAVSTNTRRDACYQICREEKWEALDPDAQRIYESKASNTAIGVATNQADFTRSIGKGLTELCEGGQVGRLELMLFWAFRDDDGHLRHGVINAHSANEVRDMADATPDWDSKFGDPWKDFAEQALPDPLTIKMPRSPKGLPIFPTINLNAFTPSSISELMEEYLHRLWRFSWKDIPPAWNEINAEPGMYYDVAQFTLPYRLQAPELLGPVQVVALAEYFASAQPPFVFRDKAEVEKLQAARQQASSKHEERSPKSELTGVSALPASPSGPPPVNLTGATGSETSPEPMKDVPAKRKTPPQEDLNSTGKSR